MNHRPATLFATVLLAVALGGCSSSDKPKETKAPASAQPLTREDSVEVTLSARVKAVDHATRIMTLQDDNGNEVTFAVAPGVRRLNEVMVNDHVRATYRATLLAELRPPTADEAAHPITVVGTGGRSPQGQGPSASSDQTIKVVTTVEAVDVPNMLVTLRGPMGDRAVVRGRKPENVQRLRVGDTIVITYSESTAVALDKVAPRGR